MGAFLFKTPSLREGEGGGNPTILIAQSQRTTPLPPPQPSPALRAGEGVKFAGGDDDWFYFLFGKTCRGLKGLPALRISKWSIGDAVPESPNVDICSPRFTCAPSRTRTDWLCA